MSTHLNYLYLMNKASEADDRQTYYYYLKQANQAKANEISMRPSRPTKLPQNARTNATRQPCATHLYNVLIRK